MMRNKTIAWSVALWIGTVGLGCGESKDSEPVSAQERALVMEIGPDGGILEGEVGSVFEGVMLEVPAGALDEIVEVRVTTEVDDTPLPEGAFSVGPQFTVEPRGLDLNLSAQMTVPFERARVEELVEDLTQVKVWLKGPEQWNLAEVVSVENEQVTARMNALSTLGAGVKQEE